MNTTEKILSRCVPEGDCLIWQGAKHVQGYGMCRVKGEMTTTHRAIGLDTHGDPGDSGKYKFTHICGNYLCCNPEHITVTTHSEIMKAFVDTRKPKSGFRGALTAEQVIEIRNHPNEGWGTNSKLARKYGVNDSTVGKIRRGEAYKWIK